MPSVRTAVFEFVRALLRHRHVPHCALVRGGRGRVERFLLLALGLGAGLFDVVGDLPAVDGVWACRCRLLGGGIPLVRVRLGIEGGGGGDADQAQPRPDGNDRPAGAQGPAISTAGPTTVKVSAAVHAIFSEALSQGVGTVSRFRPDGQRAELVPSRVWEEVKLPVDGGLDPDRPVRPERRVLVYPSGLDLSSSTLRFLSGLLSARRRERGTRWRRLPADRQALLVLAHLHCGHTYTQLAAGVGIVTVYRYLAEAVAILAALAPDLAAATGTRHAKLPHAGLWLPPSHGRPPCAPASS